jgi:uncharacterized membrane protein YraQ (UPF0718 family)
MRYVNEYFASFWEMTVLMHGYIILGLIIAGIIREFISDDYIKNNLGGKGFFPAVKATLLGLPLPLCSCGVIPLAASLRKSGAGKGAVSSFFISTPMTGADSIIATYGVFGWLIASVRVFSAGFAAIFAGFFIDKYTKDDDFVQEETSCCSGSCCGSSHGAEEKTTFLKRVKNIFNYAFYELLDDLAFPLLTGLIMAALITLFITPEIAASAGGVVAGYIFAFVAGVPLYVCSISAIPIALSLMVAGFSPGAAFIFLAAAPATNIVTLNVFGKLMGRRGVVIYLVAIVLFTLVAAVMVDTIYLKSGLEFTNFAEDEESFGTFANLTSGLFLLIITWLSVKKKMLKRL